MPCARRAPGGARWRRPEAALSREQLAADVAEGLEFQGVAGRIENEERRLLTRGVGEARVRLNHPLDLMPLQPLGEPLPLVRLEHHSEMRDRYAVAVDRIEVRCEPALRTEALIQVANELVAIEIEIHPVARAPSFRAAEHPAIEAPRLVQVAHLYCHVKGRQRHARG